METQKPKTDKRENAGLVFSIIAIVLVLFMLFLIPIGPMKKYKATQRELAGLREDLKIAQKAKEAEVTRLQNQEQVMELLKTRPPGFDLWSFMNTVLTSTNLKERANLENYKPRTARGEASEDVTMVRLRLDGVTLTELTDLLYAVYSSNNLVVVNKVDYLRPASSNKGIECSLTLLSPKPLKAA